MRAKFLKWIVRVLFRLLTRLEVTGLEHIPETGGCLIAVNHLSRLYPPLAFAYIQRDEVTALVASKYKNKPFFNWVVNLVGGIWINREEADRSALREAINYLKGGGVLGIAPEGTRSDTGVLQQAKSGVAYLADRAGVPVVPAAVIGTEDAFQTLFRLQRPRIRLEFGEAVQLPPVDRRTRVEDLQRNTDEIMCRIAVLLPERYRGAYSEQICQGILGEGR